MAYSNPLLCPKCSTRVVKADWQDVKEIDYGVWDIAIQCRCGHSFIHRRELKRWGREGGYYFINRPQLGSSYRVQSSCPEHIYVWERVHGKTPEDWVIHHINGDKHDNRLENLVAVTKDEHHAYLQRWGQKFSVTCPHCQMKFPVAPNQKSSASASSP